MTTPPVDSTPDVQPDTELLARRKAVLGPYSPTFYTTPLELVSGEGVWLTDVDGKTYLDGYNNVPHVGHANPVVADAMNEQLRTLNLHTRYLNNRVVDYAEKLLSTFEDRLDRVFFTNSGSEANELALRVARQHTGNTGILISDFSYHGNTTSLAELTTGIHVAEPIGAHVRPIRIPDVLGADTDEGKLLDTALAEVDAAIASLRAAGYGVSAFLFDSLFSTEGLVVPPAGYVEGVVNRVHAAGGLVIADEVQSGFGRVGTSMWGYQMFDIEPDLVVLGKPMGNGQPIGAAITTQALLEEFGSRNVYFNTFAGSPVSSAAGMAVLQVMEDQDLLRKTAELGDHIAAQLTLITATNPRIKSVRGRGLFFGLEIVHPDDRRTPDPAFTRALVEEMRERGILISRIGRHDNVLKMRPPLVCTREHADLLISTLDAALDAVNEAHLIAADDTSHATERIDV
ncbi:aspartate aminotransferase family protein [Microbacterium sp. SORGH_AS_0888]|uniref:aspartate aminotransferase family protein n=1 Tax=Microbacterium sp. SORGH_AS_0888 TaxID=3041791 RepID=UPI002782FC77|nr:aspartate aminotransferase family protein [Microbacterium sp. SORGH_AS_0888]MDQ1130691.1 4-aminobutyrate aminotransferase-like enzyme [Microbacterium sp. SORGH_AS_0888]